MFDPVLKRLADDYDAEFVPFFQQLLGLPTGGEFEVVQPNVPRGTLDVDRVYRVNRPGPMLIHTEWESSAARNRPDRFLVYNTLLFEQTQLPVQTVVVLLRPEANSSDLTGELSRALPNGKVYKTWKYEVVKLWEVPSELVLATPGLSPLAPLCKGSTGRLSVVVDELLQRWSKLPAPQVGELASATKVLMGLCYDKELIDSLFTRVGAMKESVVYQEILKEGKALGIGIGRIEQAREQLILLGEDNCGPVPAAARREIDACADLHRLNRMMKKMLKAHDWTEVLAVQ